MTSEQISLEPTGERHTVRKTFALAGAPDVETNHGILTPTEIVVTFQWSTDEKPTSDVSLRFSGIPGHYPMRHYFASTEKWRPRPDWVTGAVTPHAPDGWLDSSSLYGTDEKAERP